MLFDGLGIADGLQKGAFYAVVVKDRHPSLPAADEPYCTRSQMVSYRAQGGVELARAHQYLRPDRTIGLSGRPDPKRVLVDGTVYFC